VDQINCGRADCKVGTCGQGWQPALGRMYRALVFRHAAAVGGYCTKVPDSGIDQARGRENPYVFAETGISSCWKQVCGMALRGAMVAHAEAARDH